MEIKKYIVPGILAIYLTISSLVCGWLLLDISLSKYYFIKWLGFDIAQDAAHMSLLKLGLYSLIGGAFGGIAFGMMNLQKHTTMGTFRIVYIGDYLCRPVGSAILAVVVFALIRGGIMTILGANPANVDSSYASSLSTFAIGFLSGFGSVAVIQRFNSLVKRIFPGNDEHKDTEVHNG